LDAELNEQQRQEVATVAKGKDLATLAGDLSKSIDPDNVDEKAREKFSIPPEQEPTEQQQDAAEQELMQAALKPFYDPKLRELILALKQSVEQIIDKEAVDVLLRAEFDAQSVERAKSLITNFNQFIEDNRQELEALQILYSKPYRAGLHYRQVKELGKALELPPVSASPDLLWRAFEAVEPGAVAGHGGKLVDVIAMVRHAIDPAQVLKPFPATVEERYQQWLTDQQAAGVAFTHEQRHWLDAIKDHIANSASIEQDDLDSVPFNQMGGQGKAYDLFGEQLGSILDELNMRLAA
jgi:type I restriction enzyme R subunit